MLAWVLVCVQWGLLMLLPRLVYIGVLPVAPCRDWPGFLLCTNLWFGDVFFGNLVAVAFSLFFLFPRLRRHRWALAGSVLALVLQPFLLYEQSEFVQHLWHLASR